MFILFVNHAVLFPSLSSLLYLLFSFSSFLFFFYKNELTSPFTFSFGVQGASAAVFSASEMPRNDRTDPLPHALYFVIYWFSCLLFLKTLFSFYGLSNGSRKPVFKGLYSSERRKSTVVYQRFCFIPHYFHQVIDNNNN